MNEHPAVLDRPAARDPDPAGRRDEPATSSPGSRVRPVSAVIIAQDEADCVGPTVRACLTFADEVLLVDGGSRDGTEQRAREAGARVVSHAWPGYAKQRNFAAAQAAHDWVVFIDADEVVGRELAESLNAWACQPDFDPDGALALRRVNNFFDRWLDRHEWQVRGYHRGRTSVREVLVHETPDVDPAKVRRLDGTLWHFGFRSLENLIQRFNRYTSLEADKAFDEGRRFKLTRLAWRPPARFVQRYVVQRRFRAGMAGLASSLMWVFYEVFKELKLYELGWQQKKAAADDQPTEVLP